jgi:hypothetical protein
MMQKVMCQKTARHAGRLFIEIKDGCRHLLEISQPFAAISLLLIGFSPNFAGIYFILMAKKCDKRNRGLLSCLEH